MIRIGFTALIFLAFAFPAFALSTQKDENVPGAFVNLADPDEQRPAILKGHQPASDNLDDNAQGQGFVNKDTVRQSAARGNGSYLPPEGGNAPQ